MLEDTQNNLGCKKPVPHIVHTIPLSDSNGWSTGSIKFNRCPGNFMQSDIGHWLEVSNHYDKGFLPCDGSISYQPSKVMEILGVVGDWKADRKKKAEETQSRKAKRA